MADDNQDLQAPSTKKVSRRAPKARSLLIHGIFAKTATKIGIVATKATFILKKILRPASSESPSNAIENNRPNSNKPPDSNATDPDVVDKKSPDNNATDPEAQDKEEPSPKTNENPKEEIEKLVQLVHHSQEVLAEATTVFPLTLFPDTITVDRTKVTIHKRFFFLHDEAFGIKVEDILGVTCAVGPFFGSLIVKIVMTGEEMSVNYFKRKDAIHLKHVIQGLIIAKHSKVNTDELNKEQLIATLEELGHDKNS